MRSLTVLNWMSYKATVTWIFEDNSLESLLVKLKCLSHLIVLWKTENLLGLLLTTEIHVYWVDLSQIWQGVTLLSVRLINPLYFCCQSVTNLLTLYKHNNAHIFTQCGCFIAKL